MDHPDLRGKEFFDELADTWDDETHHDPAKLKLISGALRLSPGATVLDVGTGTGVMVPYLLEHVGKSGTIVAVDHSEKMIAVARRKFPHEVYPNVKFVVADVKRLPMRDEYDGILCYSCFPHFRHPWATVEHLTAGLKRNGRLVIAHSESRDTINELHRGLGALDESLPPMDEMRRRMEDIGLWVVEHVDSDEMFMIVAEKPGDD